MVATEVAIPLLLATAPRIGIPAVILLHLGFSVFLPGLASFGLAMAAMAVLYAPLSFARDSGS